MGTPRAHVPASVRLRLWRLLPFMAAAGVLAAIGTVEQRGSGCLRSPGTALSSLYGSSQHRPRRNLVVGIVGDHSQHEHR